MRYSFHGKVRATGQTIDGFIEAESASLAIDRLADKGIIGVYSVRPDPKPVKTPPPTSADPRPNALPDRRNPKALANGRPPAANEATPANAPPKPATDAQSTDPATHELLKALADKIASLTGKVETMLAKPSSVVYQQAPSRQGPVRESGRGPQRSPRLGGEQTSTLRDIFQNNLDLRHSLEKLASSVGGAPAKIVEPTTKSTNGSHTNSNGSTNSGLPSNAATNGNTGNGAATNGKAGHDPASSVRPVVNPTQSA